jgi:pteridine reductase
MAKCVVITGAARRIGAAIARGLHAAGYRVIVHYRESVQAAVSLSDELNRIRPQSAGLLQADLAQVDHFADLARRATAMFGRIDGLINNAATFYPTPLDSVTEAQWDELIGGNLKAPYFLSLAFAQELEQRGGSIVNIADIHGLRPLSGFSIYSLSKAGLNAMTLALARELAPSVRVNAVAPGAILWPEAPMNEGEREAILAKVALQHTGTPKDIAETVLFLLNSRYITGHIIPVDGGRNLYS